jgi:peptidyl-prolyl cis-trans isomerase SurA
MTIRPFIFLSLLLLSAVAIAQPATRADKIVAIVGDNIILQSDIEVSFLQEQSRNAEVTLSPAFKCQILDNLLLEKLFVAQGVLDSVVVPEEEVRAELDRRVKYFISVFGSREKLEEYYGKTISELKDEFTEDVRTQLMSDKVRGKAFSGLKVSPQEVKKYFDQIPKDSVPFFNSEIEVAQVIMYPKISDEAKQAAKQKLEGIKKEIENGMDFSLQAILYSDDPGSASDGGNLGMIERGELVPDFEAAAYRLNEGEISQVVETPFGFHLIKLDEKRGDRIKARHILIRAKLTNNDVLMVKERMDSVHKLLVDKQISFREAVNSFSDDENSKSSGGMMTNPKNGTTSFEKADIEGGLIFTIDQLKVGEISEVLSITTPDRTGETKSGYRFIMLESETPAHRASLETDYAKIQAAAKNEKQSKELTKWIDLHKDNTFIKIDPEFNSCDNIKKWSNDSN